MLGSEVEVAAHADLQLQRGQRAVEHLVRHAERDLAEELDQAPVRVPAEARVAGRRDQAGERRERALAAAYREYASLGAKPLRLAQGRLREWRNQR